MSFRFEPSDATVEAAVRRIACAELDATLAGIRADDLPIERVIHDVRQRCKALRGLIRLVRPVLPAFATENIAFRDVARSLGGARDGKVLADTLKALAAEPDAALNPLAMARVRERLCAAHSAPAGLREALDGCVAPLIAARVRAATWTLTDDGWDALAPGFLKTMKAARRSMREFEETGDVEAGHRWRKHAKYHWQHMRLLRGVAREPGRKRAKRTLRLSGLLGERHDLDLLAAALAALPPSDGDEETIARLTMLSSRRSDLLDAKAAPLGRRLFGRRPHKLASRWSARWRQWAG